MTRENSRAIEEEYIKERERLFNFIKKQVREDDDALDILQDVFYQLMIGKNSIDSLERVTSWLFTVAKRRIIDWYRKKKPTAFSDFHFDEDDEGEESYFMNVFQDLGDSPEDVYITKTIRERLEEGLMKLPKEQREVFVAHEIEGKILQRNGKAIWCSTKYSISKKKVCCPVFEKIHGGFI